ncbi:MAG: TraR/DksA family transcriptional regulator [Elusimicrobia bacterium]|nr:TraR/DksA family transcriptional regulator [Elusimicrobiota bacterium]
MVKKTAKNSLKKAKTSPKSAAGKTTPQAKSLKGDALAYGKKDQNKLRKQLVEMRTDLMHLVKPERTATMLDNDIGDEADKATISVTKEILYELSDKERKTIDEIEAALRRMEKGSYGLCEACRKPIPLLRLSAIPFARYCIACQSTSEQASLS